MTDLVAFAAGIESQVKKIEESALEAQKMTVRKLYDRILANSRVHSGYYKSNHRILVGTDSAKLFPSKRGDPEVSQFIDNVEASRQAEFAKLERVKKLGQIISIGTAVPYAPDLETRDATYSRSASEVKG